MQDGRSQVRVGSRSNEVYARLKAEIVEWRLQPGTPLSEPDLARRLGASRTPVREALQRLHHEGLVRLIPGRGAMVSDLSISGLVELFQLREALEGYAARLAARGPGDPRVQATLDELERAGTLVTNNDIAEFYRITSSLDELIVEMGGNSLLQQALAGVWEQVVRARRLATINPRRLHESAQEHLELLRAIASRDEDAADAVARRHVRNSLRNVLESSSLPSSGDLAR